MIVWIVKVSLYFCNYITFVKTKRNCYMGEQMEPGLGATGCVVGGRKVGDPTYHKSCVIKPAEPK